VGYYAHNVEKRKCIQGFCVKKPQVEIPLGRPRCRWEDDIKVDAKKEIKDWGVLISPRLGTDGRLF